MKAESSINAREHFGRVAVLMGGVSVEREISLASGRAVYKSLLEQGLDVTAVDVDPSNIASIRLDTFDRAFIILHGQWGEDGIVQGALESIGLPYSGSNVLGCALAMDKVRSKQIWLQQGITTAPFQTILSEQELQNVADSFNFPIFVKPSGEGSSVGVSKVKSAEGCFKHTDSAST